MFGGCASGWQRNRSCCRIGLLGACGGGSPSRGAAGGRLQIVAAENFWGSITAQLAGDRARVTSIITNPATDPHDYEATPQDARGGLRRLRDRQRHRVRHVGAEAARRQPQLATTVLDVGKLVGVKTGGNPHQWYSPASVKAFVARVAADLARLDPANAHYFAQRRTAYEQTGLGEYNGLIAEIKARYAGTPVGGSESIVAPLVSALGLTLKTPESYLDAVAEGNEPTAHDTAIVNQQIAQKVIKVFIFNSQNATPDVQRLVDAARARGIPVTTVTETLVPAGSTFQAWQSRELRALARRARPLRTALRERYRASGRSRSRGVEVAIGGRTVWRDVDLEVAAGEFVAVLGPERRREVDPAQGPPRSASAERGRDPGARPARGSRRSRHRLSAPTPELRSRPADPRRRRRATGSRRRPLGACRCRGARTPGASSNAESTS